MASPGEGGDGRWRRCSRGPENWRNMSANHLQHRPDSAVSPQRSALDYLALGHVTLDRQPDGGYLPGGTVLFSTVQAARLGLRAGIITAGRPADLEGPLAPFREEVTIDLHPADGTTIM